MSFSEQTLLLVETSPPCSYLKYVHVGINLDTILYFGVIVELESYYVP